MEYKQTAKDRKDESRGMKEYYRESFDLREDHSAIANLPPEVKMKTVGCGPFEKSVALDDTMRGIDDLARQNERRVDASMRKSVG